MSKSLPPDQAHVWYAFTDSITEGGLLDRYRAILSAEEIARHDRFLYEKHRHQFLVSHALLRCVLSLYADVHPAEWTFATTVHGKPEIASQAGLGLRFNLSHTQGLAAAAVVLKRDVGVDVENVERRAVGLELAERFFAASETSCLAKLDARQRREAFFDFWTLKEAYIKARGLGLSLPLADFAFHLEAGRPPGISFSERIADDPASWQFAQFRPGPVHKLAVAIHRPSAPDLTIVLRETVPGVGIGAK